MTYFISGGAKNGKSTLAQDLTVSLAKGGRHYYVATMISTGAEDDDRIRRHLADRDGLGFETVECFRNILDCLQTADKDGVFLVDSVTALIQNSLFPVEKNYEMDLEAAHRCTDELVEFAHTVRHAVFVSDYIYSDAEAFSESTEAYRKCLADIDCRLAKVCDTVIEVSAGQPIIYKGELILIIGGAYQGKLDFAKETFGITDSDVYICGAGEIDFSKRCIYKIEEFTYNHPDPIGYFQSHREQWQDSILILQDIFCGVVPMGAENRAWRQRTGRLAQYLSKEATQVSRIFCGLEQRLK